VHLTELGFIEDIMGIAWLIAFFSLLMNSGIVTASTLPKAEEMVIL